MGVLVVFYQFISVLYLQPCHGAISTQDIHLHNVFQSLIALTESQKMWNLANACDMIQTRPSPQSPSFNPSALTVPQSGTNWP